MVFVIIRLIFWIIASIVSFIIIKRSKAIYKFRWSIVVFAVVTMLTTISAWIPIENGFMTFSSPASAYNYNHSGNVTLIVEGEQTDFVIGVKGDTDLYAIIPKTSGGWKLGMSSDTKRIVQTIADGIVINVYQYKNTNDYFITVLDTNGGSLDITDNHNSEFKYLEKSNSTLKKTFYTYYAYINGFDNQYVLTANGESIKIQN